MTTNERGKPIYELLRQAGLKVRGVIVLGPFVHVECYGEETARRVGGLMQPGGFKYLKTSPSFPKNHLDKLATWTAYFKVAP